MKEFSKNDVIRLATEQLQSMELELVKCGVCNCVGNDVYADASDYLLYDTYEGRLVTNPIDEETGEYLGYRKYDFAANVTLGSMLKDDRYIEKLRQHLDGVIINRGLLDALNQLKETVGDNAYGMIYDQLLKDGKLINAYDTNIFEHMELLSRQADKLERIDCDMVYAAQRPNLTKLRDELRGDDSDVDKAFDDALALCDRAIGGIEGSRFGERVVRDNENGVIMGADNQPLVYDYNNTVRLIQDNLEKPLKQAIIDGITEKIGGNFVDYLLEDDVDAPTFDARGGIDSVRNDKLIRFVEELGNEAAPEKVAAYCKVASLTVALDDLVNFGDCVAMDDHIRFMYNKPTREAVKGRE